MQCQCNANAMPMQCQCNSNAMPMQYQCNDNAMPMSSGSQSSATVPLGCHSDQSTATHPKFGSILPIGSHFANCLPLSHWSATGYLLVPLGLCKRWACEARGQNWSETKVIVGLDPPIPLKIIICWHTVGTKGVV